MAILTVPFQFLAIFYSTLENSLDFPLKPALVCPPMTTPEAPPVSWWAKLRPFLFPHTVYLESELERARTELKYWQNALLTEKGLTLPALNEPRPLPHMKAKLLPSQWKTKMQSLTRKKEADSKEKPNAA